MKVSIFSLLLPLLSVSHSFADLSKMPKEINFSCSGGVSALSFLSEEYPYSYTGYNLQYIDPKFEKQEGKITLQRTADIEICAYNCETVANWEATQEINLPSGFKLRLFINVHSDAFAGDFLTGKAVSFLRLELLNGSNPISILTDSFTTDTQNQLRFESMRVENSDLARFLLQKKMTLNEYMGEEGRISRAESVARALELYKAVGDGKGLVDNFRIGCLSELPESIPNSK